MRFRFYLLLGLLSVIILTWAVYLFTIQIFDPLNLDKYRDVRYNPQKEILVPTRGSIYDINGNLFVSSVTFYQVDIDRKQVYTWAKKNNKTKDSAYQIIAKAFGKNSSLPEEFVFKKLTQNDNLNSIQISNKINESELESLYNYFKGNKLPGFVYTFSSMKRIYSRGINAARLLGSVQENTSETDIMPSQSVYKLYGCNGLEATYDKELRGQTGWREVFYNARNSRINYPNLKDKKPVNGLNVWLTIDSSIQDVVEEALTEGLQKYGAKNAAAVVMDANTGKIYAMAGVSAEDFREDPGFVRVKSNIPVSFLFEPGSTMKPFTALTALDYNLIKPKEMFPTGTRKVGNRPIRDTHDYGVLNARGVMAKSSNVGISIIGDRVGPKKLYDKLIQLGFGQKTGLNLFGESSGIFHKLENWDGYTLHSISFGYAMSVSAVQLAAAYCVVANGGNYVKPYIVDSFRDETGKVLEKFEPKLLRRVVSQSAADTLKSYLQSVVDDGTAKHIKLNFISLAGKTGTAKKKLEGSRGYSTDKYTGNFVGFFPVDKPEMVIAVVYDEPTPGVHYGGLCAAPTFQRIVERILFLPQCDILPKNKQLHQSLILTPHVIGMTIPAAINVLRQNDLNYKIETRDSSHIIIDQFPKPNVSLDKSHTIVLITGNIKKTDENLRVGIMPDLTGMSLRKAVQVSSQYKVKLKIHGIGKVQKQSILAGTSIMPGSTCVIEASL